MLGPRPWPPIQQALCSAPPPLYSAGIVLDVGIDEWEMCADEIVLGPRIGIGSYGEVYRAQWRQTDVAVKRFLEQEVSPKVRSGG